MSDSKKVRMSRVNFTGSTPYELPEGNGIVYVKDDPTVSILYGSAEDKAFIIKKGVTPEAPPEIVVITITPDMKAWNTPMGSMQFTELSSFNSRNSIKSVLELSNLVAVLDSDDPSVENLNYESKTIVDDYISAPSDAYYPNGWIANEFGVVILEEEDGSGHYVYDLLEYTNEVISG